MDDWIDAPKPGPTAVATGVDREPAGRAFERPRGVRDAWLLILTIGGRGWAATRAGDLSLGPGDALLFAPRTGLAYGAPPASDWRRAWVVFVPRPHWEPWLDWPPEGEADPGSRRLGPLGGRIGRRMRRALAQAHRFAQRVEPHGRVLAMTRIEEALLWARTANPLAADRAPDPRLRRAMEGVMRRLDEPLSVDEIARLAGVSRAQVSRLFRAELGTSPMRFLETRRLRRAAELLTMTGEPVEAIARRVGFRDPFYFSTRFRRRMGASPAQYRATAKRSTADGG